MRVDRKPFRCCLHLVLGSSLQHGLCRLRAVLPPGVDILFASPCLKLIDIPELMSPPIGLRSDSVPQSGEW